MRKTENLWFILFISTYILIEISLRNYAIDIIGTIHVLPYQINSMEFIGRVVSSIGFSVFIIKNTEIIDFGNNVFQKLGITLAVFLSLFLFQKIIFDNAYRVIDSQNTEDIYKAYLFKESSYYNPNISPKLPVTISEKDTVDFKTFYGLSLFLYNNNKKIEDHITKYEEEYLDIVIDNYFNKEEFDFLVGESYSEPTVAHEVFVIPHAYIETNIKNLSESSFMNGFLLKFYQNIYHYYTFKHQPKRYKDRTTYGLDHLEYLYTNKFKKELVQDYKHTSSLFIKDIGYRKVNEIYIKTIEELRGERVSNRVKGYIQTNNFSYEHFVTSVRAISWDKSYNKMFKIFSNIFNGITKDEYEKLFFVLLNSNNKKFQNVILSKEFKEILYKYDNWLIKDPKILVRLFDYYNENRDSYIEESRRAALVSKNDPIFAKELSKVFKQYLMDNLKKTKNDKELMGNALLIPPLVLLISDIALFLNIALLFSILISSKLKIKYKKKRDRVTSIISFFIFITILLLSGYKFFETPFHEFRNNTAKEYMKIDERKLIFVEWFMNKNHNLDKIYLSRIQILKPLIDVVEKYEIQKAINEKEMLSQLYDERKGE